MSKSFNSMIFNLIITSSNNFEFQFEHMLLKNI